MSKAATMERHETLADFPEVQAKEKRANEMLTILREREAELQKALAEKPGSVGVEALRLLNGDATATPDILALRHSVAVAKEAHRLAEVDWQQARVAAGAELCKEHQAEHSELLERIENAFLELVDSLQEENRFFHSFLQRGVQQPSFSRPYIANHGDLLHRFMSVRPDEFCA